jgi:hypothetical protein
MLSYADIEVSVYIRDTVNNFVELPHSGSVMHCSEYMEPPDGAVSVLLSSQ